MRRTLRRSIDHHPPLLPNLFSINMTLVQITLFWCFKQTFSFECILTCCMSKSPNARLNFFELALGNKRKVAEREDPEIDDGDGFGCIKFDSGDSSSDHDAQRAQQPEPKRRRLPQTSSAHPSTSFRQSISGVSLPPWVASKRRKRGPYNGQWFRRLNDELKDYVQWVQLKPFEKEARLTLISKITSLVHQQYPKAQVEVFGSFATGLSTMGSDVDICVVMPNCTDVNQAVSPTVVRNVSSLVYNTGIASYSEAITKAKVPIVKARAAKTNIEFDIGFNALNGPEHTETTLRALRAHRYSKELILILKLFLKNKGLNQPYTGGMGGYVLLQLVCGYLRSREMVFNYRINEKWALAQVLMEFLEFYGMYFGERHACVDTRRSRPIRTRTEINLLDPSPRQRDSDLFVLDPQDATHSRKNIGSGCFKYMRIKESFQWAYWYLMTRKTGGYPTILGKIIRPDLAGMRVRSLCEQVTAEREAAGVQSISDSESADLSTAAQSLAVSLTEIDELTRGQGLRDTELSVSHTGIRGSSSGLRTGLVAHTFDAGDEDDGEQFLGDSGTVSNPIDIDDHVTQVDMLDMSEEELQRLIEAHVGGESRVEVVDISDSS
eukprot:gnl/Dysnectes_brevis/2445_a2912_1239.p1 GENE.gnl/Dysnectes_brevis/2445_a2912_1239~~gnl/Dysnectes_brevis/2445_a2912_1239.p1  ORF type:complete len:607 (-),score=73.00 gnl/Dysnectes_brevis/2445_a2912_1239:135-1955(-)